MKIKPRNLLGIIMTIILICSTSTILYKNIINTVEENRDITINELKEKQFEIIWSSFSNIRKEAEQDVNKIASSIENDIYSLSDSQLQQLSYDMDNNVFNKQYHDILLSNIEDYSFKGINNHQNGIIIMNMCGYVEDFNYRRAEVSSDSNSDTQTHLYREWSYGINNAYNKELEKDAIDKLLNRTTGIIATESYNMIHNNNHIMIDELTYETLLNVFINEGMNGLKNYQIFTPHYITNVGDIFGTPDISHGVKLENHKIIVVVEFNLYDQLMKENSEYDIDENISDLIYRYDNLLCWLYIFGIVIIISVIILILYLCSIYNKLILLKEIHGNEESENIES